MENTDQYATLPGLTQSAMKDLAVSPLRYWYLHINPNRPEEKETPAMVFGSALHCAVLEPDKFDSRYACALSIEDIDGCLDTIGDIRAWLTDRGVKPKGTLKQDLILQCQQVSPDVPIWSVIQAEHAKENEGKAILSKEFWENVGGAAKALRSQPALEPILAEGRAEVTLTAIDPETKVPLKGKLDWLTSYCTLDLKTFSQQRGKSIDRTIADAIYYECYYRQAYVYSLLRRLNQLGDKPPFIIAFVESEPPHEVRLKELRPKLFGQVNVYWERARIETRDLIETYARYRDRFGIEPWVDEQDISQLEDSEIPQLAY